jgi:hypothetical protein
VGMKVWRNMSIFRSRRFRPRRGPP